MGAQLQVQRIGVDGVHGPVLAGGCGHPGEAVLFVHGNPGAGADWLPLMTPVAEFANVIAPDMPGFGGADKRADQDYTVPAYARYLAGVVDRFGLERVHVVAHDFGGPFALTWAANDPDRVASVTLINTGVLLDYRWHALARLWRTPVVGELLMRASTPTVAKTILRLQNPNLPVRWRDVLAQHLMPAATKRAVLRLYRSSSIRRHMDPIVEPLRALDPDTLVVCGDTDAYIPAAMARRQVQVFARAVVEVLPGVGHWAWLERPDRIADLVVPFLRARVCATANR